MNRLALTSISRGSQLVGALLLALAVLTLFNLTTSGTTFWAALGQSFNQLCNLVAGLAVLAAVYAGVTVLFSRFSGLRVGRAAVVSGPFLWLFLFFLLPFFIVLKISFAEADVAIPPYTEIYSYAEQKLDIVLNLANYLFLSEDELYLAAYLGSLKIAFFSTVLCLLIGYPMAYAIARARKESQTTLLLLIMMPTWTAILIRVYAWMGILSNNGLLNGFLLWTGLISEPLQILNTNIAVYIGVVYSYLPFMILPLYANLVKHDHTLLEAASDLGSSNFNNFWKITVPLSKNGIIAGSMLVFIPVVGEFVIPELLGGPETLMIGKVLWQEFFNNRDWPVASALAVVMLVILIIPIILFNRNQAKELEGRV